MIKKSLLLLLIVFFKLNLLAYDGFDECEILEEKLKQNSDLDSPNDSFWEYPGIELEYYTPFKVKDERKFDDIDDLEFEVSSLERSENNEVILGKIHPDLYEELLEKDISDDVFLEPIKSINSKHTAEMSDEEIFYELSEKEDVKLVIGDEHIYLKKKKYTDNPVNVAILVKTINQIKSRESQVDLAINIHQNWIDDRITKIMHEVWTEYKEINYEDATNYNYYCEIPLSFFKENNLYHPRVGIRNFSSTEVYSNDVRLDYYQPGSYEDENKFEKIFGSSFIQNIQSARGILKNDFRFKKFPFDEQYIEFILESGFEPIPREEGLVFEDIHLTDFSFERFFKSVKDLPPNPEWKYIEVTSKNSRNVELINYVYIFDKYLAIAIKRESTYYLTKIFLPILLILIISWSTFWINPREIESRITVSIVCLLSLIAYNFVVDKDLPRLSYLTLMDITILVSYFFSGIPVIQTVAVGALISKKRRLVESLDKIFRYLTPVAYFLILLSINLLVIYEE